MTQPLTLEERRARLREAIALASARADALRASEDAGIGALMKELSADIEALEHNDAARADAASHDAAERRLEALLAELAASHGNGG